MNKYVLKRHAYNVSKIARSLGITEPLRAKKCITTLKKWKRKWNKADWRVVKYITVAHLARSQRHRSIRIRTCTFWDSFCLQAMRLLNCWHFHTHTTHTHRIHSPPWMASYLTQLPTLRPRTFAPWPCLSPSHFNCIIIALYLVAWLF